MNKVGLILIDAGDLGASPGIYNESRRLLLNNR
jgi:hypothetical protein